MVNILNVSADKATAIRNSTRVAFIIIGMSLIIMEMVYPPVRALWMVLGYFFGAVLVLYSIMGLAPQLKISGFGKLINNTMFHVVFNFLTGMAIIVTAMIYPPILKGWYIYFNIVGILLIFDAMITSSWHASRNHKSNTLQEPA